MPGSMQSNIEKLKKELASIQEARTKAARTLKNARRQAARLKKKAGHLTLEELEQLVVDKRATVPEQPKKKKKVIAFEDDTAAVVADTGE